MRIMKRILALLLSLTMLMSLLIVPANAADEDVVLKITPDKTSINTATAQDVTYTVSVEVKDSSVKIGGMQFTLDAPSGVTVPTIYYEGFWTNEEQLKTKSQYGVVKSGIFETFEYTFPTHIFIASGTTEDRNLHENAEIMKIKVSVAENTTGPLNFTAKNVEFAKVDGGAEKWTYRIETTPVTITKAPIESVTASVEKPEAGKKLDFVGSFDSSAPYKIEKVEWFEGTGTSGSPLPNPTTAGAEQFYSVRITLTANSGETFDEKFKTGTTNGDYSVTRVSDTELYLTKAYRKTGKLTAAKVTAAPTAYTGLEYKGSEQFLLNFGGNASGGTMQYSLDNSTWSTNIPKGTNAKTYTVYYKAVGDGTHSDSAVASISAEIKPKDISGVTIGTIENQPYTGSAITPNPEVKDGATVLEKDKDYTVSCTDKYVGTATLTITGKGNYTGTKDANFAITAVNQNPTFITGSLVKCGHRLDLRTLVRDAKGTVIFTISGGGGTSTHAELESDGYTLTSTGIPGTVNINVRIAAQNEGGDSAPEYNEFIKTDAITVNVINKTTDSSTMTVTQDNIIYGETVSPSVTNKPDDTGTVSYTYVGREGTTYSSATAPTNVGKYTVKAKCESSTTIYTAEVNFAIQPKSISGVTVTLDKTSLEYTGSARTVNVTGVGTLTDADYTVTDGTSGTNVGSYTVKVTGKGNYNGTATATWKITQATPTYTAPTGLTAKYGQTLADVNIAATTGWSWMDSTQSVGDASTTAKTFKAKFTPTDNTNYKTVEDIDVSVTVEKAAAPTLADITLDQKYTVTTGEKAIGTVMPANAGTLTYAKGTEIKTGSVTVTNWDVDSTGKVTYTLSGGAAGDTVTLPVTIKSTNYADSTVNVVITLIKGSSGGYYYAPTTAVVPDMPMLYRGCTGDAVKTLQDKLNTLGYNSGSVDGIFGAKTYAAVTAFQKANSLGVDGIVGKLTWGKLYGVSPAMPVETTTVVGRPMVSYGSRGDAVRKLQELLNALGYDCGSVDGIFGSKTKAAVLAFQKANGLGVDGIVGPLTWAKLG